MTELDDIFDDDALAAEYALHLLDAEARRAFETRMRIDQNLRALAIAWEARLIPMAEEIAPVEPPAKIKARVIEEISGPKQAPTSSLSRVWAFLLGAGAVAAVAGFLMVSSVFESAPDLTPAFRAELSAPDASIVLVASVIPATHEIVVEPVSGTPPDGRIFELWLIAEGASVPVSLGVLETGVTTRITVPDEIAPSVRTGTIAISDEPPGGSPTGTPTGTVLATATFQDI